MIVIEQISELRKHLDALRAQGKSVGLVPTMGYLHAGHRSLMQAARAAHDVVVVSIFVNPLQFGSGEDIDRYPRDPMGDELAASQEGVDIMFAPSVAEMYPNGEPLVTVNVESLSAGLCGASRSGHFNGVATVVLKLFSIVGPCVSYFGRKDFQQLAVIRRMVDDLNLPVEVVGCPLVREPDGVAMSSRNSYLSAPEREAARVLSRALRAGAEAVTGGERDPATLRRLVGNCILTSEAVRLEYVEVVRSGDLGPLERLDGEVLVALAAHVGTTRLIDNMILTIDAEMVTADLGVTESETSCAAR